MTPNPEAPARTPAVPPPARHALARLEERYEVALTWEQFESIEARLRDLDARRARGSRGGWSEPRDGDPAFRFAGTYPTRRRHVVLYWASLHALIGWASDSWIPVLFNRSYGQIETFLSRDRGVRRCG